MNVLKELITKNDTWTSAEGMYEGKPFLIRFRPHLHNFILSNEFNTRFIVLWSYKSEEVSLIPNKKEMNLMRKFENASVDFLENDLQAVLSFVYTGLNKREWHWYSKDVSETETRLNKVLLNFNSPPIQFFIEDDPTWQEYNAVLEGNCG